MNRIVVGVVLSLALHAAGLAIFYYATLEPAPVAGAAPVSDMQARLEESYRKVEAAWAELVKRGPPPGHQTGAAPHPALRRLADRATALFEAGLYCRTDNRGEPVVQRLPYGRDRVVPLADHDAVVQDDAIANGHALANGDVRMDDAVLADAGAGSD